MLAPTFSLRIQFVTSHSRRIIPLSSLPCSLLSTAHRFTKNTIGSRSYSQYHSYHSHTDAVVALDFWGMASIAASATAGISLLGISSSSSQTLCESAIGTEAGSSESILKDEGEVLEGHPEIEPYDHLPEKDEPTHCSICLTYRQGPCRPYWRKVEACTKDGEKERKKKEEEGVVSEDDNKNTDENDSSSPMSESTRCFKYMMPWIDCASKYRNLYTLIEMDTNYTEGIKELEATSRHFCWVPGKEPKIDWSNWHESSTEIEEEGEKEGDPNPTKNTEANADTDLVNNVALWKTLDPTLGDPKLITIEAKVPTTINSGLGILECAYAVDQDNNVIGFAYGTKPSDLIEDESKKKEYNNDEQTRATEYNDDEKSTGEIGSKNDEEEKMVTLNIRLVVSRTQDFVLSASYTHRIEKPKTSKESDKMPIVLESHLYKSKPLTLTNVPKLTTESSKVQEQ